MDRKILRQKLDRLHSLQRQNYDRGGLYNEWDGGIEMKELSDEIQKYRASGQIDPKEFDALSMKYFIKHNLS